ncbi:MAG TPA: SPOR domain-containing protein [Aliidongia sp.]|uniref:SPOR domain-containing protein n=1 Tax=Aliidongia sp. TaxID=1914230 RepID=UPI002DDCE91A|nr:SPOR domain-containing protein [Aliidongia sp.]HEV2678128.1 SPOR domain-containing protein [Aliidongia sp.]
MPPRLFPDEPEQRRQDEGLSIDPTERPYYAGEDEPRRGGMLRNILVVCVMVACAGAIYFAYSKGKQAGGNETGGAVPLIRADQDPTKKKPDDAGGSTPDQDKLVYNPNDPNGAKVERLLPPPEQPLPKPLPSAPEPLPVQNIAPVAAPQAAPPTAAAGVATNAASQQANATGMMSSPPGAKAAPGVEIPPAPPPQAQTAPGKPMALTPQAAARPVPPPTAAAATGPLRVQIAATKDEASARAEFARLQKAHGDLLGNLSATVVKADLGDKGTFYRIQAGPIADKAQADKLCGQLKPLGIGCIVVH